MKRATLGIVAALLALSLSGCSVPGIGSDKPTGFSVSGSGLGPYTFTASDSAANYTWDLGDHLTILYGKRVVHTYDFTNGNVTVTLMTEKADGTEKDYQKTLVLGNGINQKATFFLEAEQNWTVPGETIRFSGRMSTDPDDDPLRYSWTCIRTGDAVRKAAHTHSGGANYGTPSAGTVSSLYAVEALPAADRTESGDFCDAINAREGRFSTDVTIAGSFERTGIYEIYMLAADPVHPSTSGNIKIWVTDAEDRPEPIQREKFEDTFTGGAGGGIDNADQNDQSGQLFDHYYGTFSTPLANLGGFVNLTFTGDDQPANLVSFVIKKGDNVIVTGGGETDPGSADGPLNVEVRAGDFASAVTYSVEVVLERGVQVDFTLDVVLFLDMDPGKVY